MPERRERVLVSLVSVLYLAYCWWMTPAGPVTAPDSAVYLAADPIVPLGYPLLLDVIGARGAVVVQPLIFAATLLLLGSELRILTGSAVVTVVILVAIIVTPGLREYHASILTESLFMSGVVGFVALVSRFLRAPTWQHAAQAALLVGLTATVRRTAVMFLPALLLMALFPHQTPRRRLVFLAAATLPLGLVLFAENRLAQWTHGEHATSLTGRHVFAKAALLDAPPGLPADDGQRRALVHLLDTTYAPIRAAIARAPAAARPSLTLFYETCLQGPCADGARVALIGGPEARQHELMADVGWQRIAASPAAFLSLTASNYASLWTALKLRHPDSAAALTEFLSANRPLPFERQTFGLTPTDEVELPSSPAVRWLQPAFLLVAWYTALLSVCAVAQIFIRRRMTPALTVACLSALTAHACLLFSALAAAALSRFVVSVLPAITIAFVLGAWSLAQSAQRRRTMHREVVGQHT